jgi:hypothetical protein
LIEIIDNHSVRTDLLTKGTVIDAGARGFRFAKELAWRGCRVIALDPDWEVTDPKHINIDFLNVGLFWPPMDAFAERWLVMTPDAEARYTSTQQVMGVTTVKVGMVSLEHIRKAMQIKTWPLDVLKLNVEGDEYEILESMRAPVARQIVVSFHEHTARARGDEAIQRIVEHLGQWYTPVQHVKDERYCAGSNFWDTLLILKELA